MTKKLVSIFVALVLILSLAACGAGEETTLTGMVISVDGTVISLVEMDSSKMGNRNTEKGERPEGMEGFGGFGNFNPENFDPENFNPEDFNGTLPEGETMPQWGGERPEMPEGMTPPEGMTIPEGMTRPENGERPDFSNEGGNGRPGFGNFASDAETKQLDIANAHISVEIDGGKASGSMEDIKAGTFVTLTLNGKGEVTNVLVSSRSFGGRRQGT